MAIVKVEIRPKGDGSYTDVIHPQTSADMVAVTDSGGKITATDVEGALAEIAGKIVKGTGSLPLTGWDVVTGDYVNRNTFPISDVTINDVVNISIDKDSLDDAMDAELCPTNESYDGGIYFYAKTVPASAIAFSYVVIK